MLLSLGALLLPNIVSASAPPSGPANRAYQAQWIWCKVESPQPFQFVRFRKTVELASRPTAATAYITADTFYRLWINGQLVMHGPSRSSRGKATVDPVAIGPYLKQGKNTLVIEALHGVCPFEALAQAPGLLCELATDSGGQRQIVAATDATWEAAEIMAWSRDSLRFSYQRGWMEQFDARRTSEEKWQPAVVLGKVGMAPWRKVEMRDIPLPAPLLPVRPASVIAVQRSDGFAGPIDPVGRFELPRPQWDRQSEWLRRLQTEHLRGDATAAGNPAGITDKGGSDTVLKGNNASVTYDFGLGYVGFIAIEASGNEGQFLDITWSERLTDAGEVRPRQPTQFNNAIRITLREGRQSFLAFMPQFVRILRVVQRGEGQITLHRLGLTEFRFAAEPKGNFRCSDEQLNRVYDAARRTAMLVTLDAYMDCPHRERNAMYASEAYSALKAVYPMFGDTSVSRRSILYGVDSREDPERIGPPGLVQIAYPMHLRQFNCVIPAGPLMWVLHAGLYQQYSGDTELVRALIPVIRRNLATFNLCRNSDGLIESFPAAFQPCWLFFDWADLRTDGVSIALNAMYAKTLDEAARLERLAGDAAHADDFAKDARRVCEAVNRYCPGDKYYPDVLLRNEKKELVGSHEASETTQYHVMWAGVPAPQRMRNMWKALRDDFTPTPLKKVQPIQGLTRAGLYTFLQRLELAAQLGDYAALVRDVKAMFLPMADSAPGTLWETPWASPFALCHSIDCGVGGILTEEVLGIRLGRPLRITPHSGGSLRWCNGYITTANGRIAVDWKSQPDRYQLRASLPKGLPAEVLLPPEAKAVWQSAPATNPWQETLAINGPATVVVTPGKVEIK
jgi:hypothetical protein